MHYAADLNQLAAAVALTLTNKLYILLYAQVDHPLCVHAWHLHANVCISVCSYVCYLYMLCEGFFTYDRVILCVYQVLC